MQVNGVSGSSHKKFSTFYSVVDSFSDYCTFKSEAERLENQQLREGQPEHLTDNEVERVVD